MKDELLVLAVPFFIVSVLLEAGVIQWVLKKRYPLVDAMGSMGTGIIEQLLIALINAALSWTLYGWVYDRFAIHRWTSGAAWVWVAAFVIVDFLYYWWHLASHKVNLLWTGHLLHHQSEQFNLSTALRQSYLTTVTGSVFYLPMAFMGFPPLLFLRVLILMTLYQFWIHTELIPRLPRFEWLFNSPSLHRVHHAINPRYLDRNFAGVFSVWDRLFGTFVPETEDTVYGVLKPLRSWNSAWANLEPWVHLARLSAGARGWGERARVWLADPAWAPGRGRATEPELQRLFESVSAARARPEVSPRAAAYVFAQFALVLGLSAADLNVSDKLPVPPQAGFVAWAVLSLAALGGICDRRPWAWPAEAARLALGAAGGWLWFSGRLGG